MAVLEHLEPKGVFRFFEDICAIPHGSGNTKAISDYLVAFAKERGLEHYQDEINNVIIIAPATPGYEQAEPVIIQGHMDMVCEQAADCTKDMSKEGLDLVVEGDRLFAKGTTLGGDDGIAVAMALALLDSDEYPHPRLEAVFTVDEETGMDGALGLDMSVLKGMRLLNIDSEEEGIFTVGCAGGAKVTMRLPIERESFEGKLLSIKLHGLKGGHSGAEIDKGRANADKLMARLLSALDRQQEMRLVSVCGGGKDNAIPLAAEALVCVSDAAGAKALAERMAADFLREFRVNDGGVEISVSEGESKLLPMRKEHSRKAISLLVCPPNGIQVMSAEIEGLVQTSLNMGIVKCHENELEIHISVRSSVASQKQMLLDTLERIADIHGAAYSVHGDYPGWDYNPASPLRELMEKVFVRCYGHEPIVGAIHAGLECGLFIEKRPGLDCVSFGPDLQEIHTCRETLFIESTRRTWKLLTEVLKEMK